MICREAITKLPRWAEFFDRPELEWPAGAAALALQGDARKIPSFFILDADLGLEVMMLLHEQS